MNNYKTFDFVVSEELTITLPMNPAHIIPPRNHADIKANFRYAIYTNDMVFIKIYIDAGIKFTQQELGKFLMEACRYTLHRVIYYLLGLGAVFSKKHLNIFIRNMSDNKFKRDKKIIKKLIKLVPVSDLDHIYMQLDMNNVNSQVKIKEIFDIFIKVAEPILRSSISVENLFSGDDYKETRDYKDYKDYIDGCYADENYDYDYEYSKSGSCSDSECVCHDWLPSQEEIIKMKKYHLIERIKHEFILSLINNHYKELVEPLNINDCSDIVCKYLYLNPSVGSRGYRKVLALCAQCTLVL